MFRHATYLLALQKTSQLVYDDSILGSEKYDFSKSSDLRMVILVLLPQERLGNW